MELSCSDRRMRRPDNPDWISKAVLYAPLLSATLLAKLALPPFGARGLSIGIPVIFAALALGMAAGRLHFDRPRLVCYLLMVGLLGCLQLLSSHGFSASSMALLIAVHLPYIFVLVGGTSYLELITRRFLDLSLLLAICGVAQFALQAFVSHKVLFPIDNFVPPSFVVQKFNAQGTLAFGSDLYRPNGVFLLEPSFLGQLLGTAVVVELCTLNRWRRLGLYGAGLLAAHSGTGLLILAVCLPIYVISRRQWTVLLLMLVMAMALLGLRDRLAIDGVLSRAGEFSATGSSGFARYVGGFYLFDQYLWDDPWRTLFGFGAGSFKNYQVLANYPVAEQTLFKIVFEFGLVGALAYFGFLWYCLAASSMPTLVKVALGLGFFLNGVYGSFQHGLVLSLLVWTASDGVPVVRAAAAMTSGRWPADPLTPAAALPVPALEA
jgi:hypothetical protein